MNKKTTMVRAFGDTWQVPRGFGRAYRTVVHEHVKWISDGKPGKVSRSFTDRASMSGSVITNGDRCRRLVQKEIELIWRGPAPTLIGVAS